jgi:acetolactate decarboxylase
MRFSARRLVTGWAVLVLLIASTNSLFANPRGPGSSPSQPVLVQVGVIDALLAGGYQGSAPLSELRRVGDFGLGTFDALDGEMVVLDGVVYQVPASGVVRRPALTLTTPFAQVLRFRPQQRASLVPGAPLSGVEAALNAAIGDDNVFAAVRIDAEFATLTARSVPRQTPPYRPLALVAKEQSVFPFSGVRGTLVGLRGPAFVRGLGVPGWHWHFLTQDRTRGGHVLGFALSGATGAQARLMVLRRMDLRLPGAGLSGLDLGVDRAQELRAVESASEKGSGGPAQ